MAPRKRPATPACVPKLPAASGSDGLAGAAPEKEGEPAALTKENVQKLGSLSTEDTHL